MKRFSSAIGEFLSKRDEKGTQYHLSRLWRNWAEAVGPQIADVARPMGHRGTTLLIGVEDQMLMQEMVYYSPALMEQANAYLGMNFFDKVHVDLIGNHVSLDSLPGQAPGAWSPEPERPTRLGGLLERLDPDSPIGRCYRAYVGFFARKEEGPGPKPPNNDIPQGGHTHE
ncbi:DciA family protein [Desulfocurvus sp. DL9XJH121]